MLPHITMALEVQARMTAVNDRNRSLEGLLDRFAVAALVSDPAAQPSFLNARAESLLADAFHLTRREADVAWMLASGADISAIAAALDLGIGTVRSHLKHVFQKTGTASQAALVALARDFSGLDLP